MSDTFKTQTIVQHLADLRKRLILIIAVNLAGALVCYQFMDPLIYFLLDLNPGMELIYVSPSELFMVYIKLALTCSVIFCFPITATQIWGFISKGLYRREKHYGLIALSAGVGFFVLGVVFCYFTALPITLDFFLRITLEEIRPMISIQNYVSFTTGLLSSFGIAFEMPVVVYLLSELDILKPSFFKRMRGSLILIIFIVAAFITPPDVLTQIMLAVPMTLLLELSILICRIVYKKKQQKAEALQNS